MSMDIEIRVEAPQALATTKAVEDGLAKVEARGAKSGEAMSKGLKEGTSAADKAKEAIGKLSEKFGELGEVEGSLGKAFASHFGEAGELFHGILSSGTIEAGALVGVGAELIHINDEYIQLANNAMRLSGANSNVNQTLHDQLSLAGDLHSSLESTMELSTIVKERSDDLGLSQERQAAFTRELGEAVQLSGHSLGEASNVINRLTFALESGLPAGKEMKNLMREYPAIAEAMQEGLGKTSKQIIELANTGRLHLRDFVGALHEAGDSLH